MPRQLIAFQAFVGFVQKVLFKDPRLPGSRAVYAGDFEIRDDTDELVTTDNWNQRVYSGANLRMSVILRLPIFPRRKPLGNFCAICRAFCDNSWSHSVPGNDGRTYWKPLHWWVNLCIILLYMITKVPAASTANQFSELLFSSLEIPHPKIKITFGHNARDRMGIHKQPRC
jgi:hypothetical protein